MGFYDTGLIYDSRRAKPRTMSRSDVYETVSVAGWRGKSGENSAGYATEIVMAESSGKTDAESDNPAGGRNVGLFQIWIGNVSQDPNKLKDPVFNANVARRIFLADGGTFKKHWDARTIAKADAADPLHGPQDEATNPVDNVSRSLGDWKDGALTVLKAITTREFWLRAGKIILGGVLVVVAILLFASEYMGKVSPAAKIIKGATS